MLNLEGMYIQRSRYQVLLVILTACLCSAGCDKEATTTAVLSSGGVSQNPESIFRFYLNDEIWRPEAGEDMGAFYALFDESTRALRIEARRTIIGSGGEKLHQIFSLEQSAVWLGHYFVDPTLCSYNGGTQCGIYRPDGSINDPILTIGRLNTAKNTIAGAFQLVMVSTDCSDTLTISNGYFSTVYLE